MMKQSKRRRAAWLAAALVVAVSAALIGAMAYEAYWAPRLCKVAEPERGPALRRIEKIGSISLAEPNTMAEDATSPAQNAGDK